MLDLENIELIKQLKHKYFRCIDTANLEGVRECFAKRSTATYIGGDYHFELSGREEIVDFMAASFTADAIGMHHGHHPEIHVIDQNRAWGYWYLQDIFISLKENTTLRGSAIYRDEYIFEDDAWRHLHTEYQRIYEEIEPRHPDTKVTYHYLADKLGDKGESDILKGRG